MQKFLMKLRTYSQATIHKCCLERYLLKMSSNLKMEECVELWHLSIKTCDQK